MNPSQLLVHFDRVSDASHAIPCLRRFILDLAVRGKLVEQDPRDEPASELLKRIQVERERQSIEGAVRKSRSDSRVDVDEIPFELPKSWARSSLGEVARYGISEKIDSNKEVSANTWVLDLEDIEKGSSRLIERVLSSSRPFQSSKTRFNKGDVLFGKLRPYLNKVLVADTDGVCTTEIVPVRGYCGMVPEYIRLVLKSPLTMKRVDRLMYGMKMPRLGTNDALALNFPLPPLIEQHRIVAKVDELMALYDRLEATQMERESRRDRLVASSLHRLNNGADPATFRKHVRFYFNRLPRLTTRLEHIQQLRQTILNLAVRGKLVPQDPNDEYAPELLKRIQAEKSRLIKEGKIRREEPVAKIEGEDIPFCIPANWQWSRLGEVLYSSFYGPRFGADEYSATGIPTIRTTDMTDDGQIVLRDPPKVIVPADRLVDFKCEKGDLLVTRTGSIGIMAIFTGDYAAIPSAYLIRLRFMTETYVGYIHLVLRSPYGQASLGLNTTKVAQPNINAKNLTAILVPFPPLAEQRRIVAKVDELMALCDRLDAQITTTQTKSRRLLEAVVHQALLGRTM